MMEPHDDSAAIAANDLIDRVAVLEAALRDALERYGDGMDEDDEARYHAALVAGHTE